MVGAGVVGGIFFGECSGEVGSVVVGVCVGVDVGVVHALCPWYQGPGSGSWSHPVG